MSCHLMIYGVTHTPGAWGSGEGMMMNSAREMTVIDGLRRVVNELNNVGLSHDMIHV
jgi:hypothetical protein